MSKNIPQEAGLLEALTVADGGEKPCVYEGDVKLLSFFLRQGECTAEISKSQISVWYSWLPRWKPSTYFINLAPGLVCRLMQLGGVQRIADEAVFQVGPGTTGTGRYVFDFEKKWVRILREEERIIIRTRDDKKSLNDPDPEFAVKIARCERCNGVLRTPIAKQCLHCGYDWH